MLRIVIPSTCLSSSPLFQPTHHMPSWSRLLLLHIKESRSSNVQVHSFASSQAPLEHVYILLRRTCRPPCCTSSAGRIAHHLRKTLAHLWYSERGCARTSLVSLLKDNLARRKCKAPQASLLRGLFLGMMRLLIPFMSELEGSRAFQALLVETSQPEIPNPSQLVRATGEAPALLASHSASRQFVFPSHKEVDHQLASRCSVVHLKLGAPIPSLA